MLKQITQFKSIINDVESFFHFESNCPTNIAKEALFECLKWIGQIEDQVKASQQSSSQLEQAITQETNQETEQEQSNE